MSHNGKPPQGLDIPIVKLIPRNVRKVEHQGQTADRGQPAGGGADRTADRLSAGGQL